MLREIIEGRIDVNDEKFRTLYEILGQQNLMVKIPSVKAFQNMAKHSGLTKEEINTWYNQVVNGK